MIPMTYITLNALVLKALFAQILGHHCPSYAAMSQPLASAVPRSTMPYSNPEYEQAYFGGQQLQPPDLPTPKSSARGREVEGGGDLSSRSNKSNLNSQRSNWSSATPTPRGQALAAQEIAALAVELQSMRTWLAVKEISTDEATLTQVEGRSDIQTDSSLQIFRHGSFTNRRSSCSKTRFGQLASAARRLQLPVCGRIG
jgi:hypothetical protein